MLTREDLESELLRMEDLEAEELEEGMYLVRDRTVLAGASLHLACIWPASGAVR